MNAVRILERVADAWNETGACYAVAHGISRYPNEVGRDLDVLVAERDVQRALAAARRSLAASGLIVGEPPPIWGHRLIAAEPGGEELLEIHLITSISWRNVLLADAPSPSERLGPFQVDPWAAVAKRLLMPLLAGSTGKLASRTDELGLTPGEIATVPARLEALFGADVSRALLAAIERRDVEAACRVVRGARPDLVRRHATAHPVRSGKLLLRSLSRRLAQPFAPCAPVVAVVGSERAVGERLIAGVRAHERQVFTSCVVRSPGGPCSSSVGLMPLAARIRDRIDSSRQRLVLYDGWPGEGSAASPAWWGRALGEPDLVLVVGQRDGAAFPMRRGRVVRLDTRAGPDAVLRSALQAITAVFLMKNGAAATAGIPGEARVM